MVASRDGAVKKLVSGTVMGGAGIEDELSRPYSTGGTEDELSGPTMAVLSGSDFTKSVFEVVVSDDWYFSMRTFIGNLSAFISGDRR